MDSRDNDEEEALRCDGVRDVERNSLMNSGLDSLYWT